jgi:hypothetical protein
MPSARTQTLAWLFAGLASTAAPLAMADTQLTAVQDTETLLKLDWLWDANTGVSSYDGTHWRAYLAPTLKGSVWDLQVWYMHIDGPHGETFEHPGHPLNYSIVAGGSIVDGGLQDHQGPDVGQVAHANAHDWNIGTWSNANTLQGGFTAFTVAHVPEPSTWLMLAGGLAAIGVGTRRRR